MLIALGIILFIVAALVILQTVHTNEEALNNEWRDFWGILNLELGLFVPVILFVTGIYCIAQG